MHLNQFRTRLAAFTTFASLDISPQEVSYFRSLPGGIGMKVLIALRKGKTPSYGILQRFLSHLDEVISFKEDPNWGSDPQSLAAVKNLRKKMDDYLRASFPAGKPKPAKKLSRTQEMMQYLTEEVEKLKPLAAKVLKAYPDPATAMKFAEDVLVESNFHRETRTLLSAVPVGDPPKGGWKALDPWSVARTLRWGNLGVFSLAIALAEALGLKAGAKKMLRTWASEMANTDV